MESKFRNENLLKMIFGNLDAEKLEIFKKAINNEKIVKAIIQVLSKYKDETEDIKKKLEPMLTDNGLPKEDLTEDSIRELRSLLEKIGTDPIYSKKLKDDAGTALFFLDVWKP